MRAGSPSAAPCAGGYVAEAVPSRHARLARDVTEIACCPRSFAERLDAARLRFPFPVLACSPHRGAQQALPPRRYTGFGVHVSRWPARRQCGLVGTYGKAFRPAAGSRKLEQVKHSSDTAARSISFDLCTPSDSGRTGKSGMAPWGTGGAVEDGRKTWSNWALASSARMAVLTPTHVTRAIR